MQRVWFGRTLVPQSETCTLGDSGENFHQKPLLVVAFTSSFIGVWIFKELHRGHVTAYFRNPHRCFDKLHSTQDQQTVQQLLEVKSKTDLKVVILNGNCSFF